MSDFRIINDYPHPPEKVCTRFTFEHTGFTGLGGFLVSKVLAAVRKKMLGVGLRAVLSDLDDEGNLRPGNA